MEPEQAIAAFERLHGVVVAVHDHAGSLVHRLPQRRLRHEHRLCRAVKAAGFERTCVAGDVQALAAEAVRHPDGFLKACHAGLVELVLPVCEHGELRWTIFAGPWRDASAPAAVRQARSSARIDGAPSLPGAWPDLLDALRNLAARLATLRPPALPLPATRREAIDRFLLLRHGEDVGLPDLAAELGLSPSRTSHAVAALYGRPFARLLVEARLASAEALLLHSELPVSTVAQRAGFGDLSHFHAVFRTRHATTPAAWRRGRRTA